MVSSAYPNHRPISSAPPAPLKDWLGAVVRQVERALTTGAEPHAQLYSCSQYAVHRIATGGAVGAPLIGV